MSDLNAWPGVPGNGLVLGAYALFAGLPDDRLQEAYALLEQLPQVAAIEMPLAEATGGRPALGPARSGLPDVISDRWDVVVTAIPTVMGRLGQDPRYGLASPDPDGRRAAVADISTALDLARDVAGAGLGRRVSAIHLHSAPRSPIADAGELERSLTELLEADSTDALLTIEHCDARRPGWTPEKGFLEIEQELDVLDALGDARLGLTINWGRSAIEGHSAQTALDHVRLAAGRGHLAGLMFSGASAAAGPWGGPWQDGHVAPRSAGRTPDAWSESLLGAEEIDAAVAAAAGRAAYLGLKVTTGAPDTPVDDRLFVARRTISMLLDGAAAAAS